MMHRSRVLGPAVLLPLLFLLGSAQQLATAPAPPAASEPAAAAQTHPRAFVYPPGYAKRLKIHKIASFATLPLFAAELALGNSLQSSPQGGAAKTAHGIIGTGIVGLFGVNTVTGIWNLHDGWADPDQRGLRLTHSVLMLVSDAGFAATVLNTPHTHGPQAADYVSQERLHRNLAYFSVGIGTVGYAIMLFRHHD